MALQVIPTQSYLYSEPFGVKGLAFIVLSQMIRDSLVSLDFAYTPAAAQSLRNAAKKIRETTGETFTFEKMGNEYREVSYPVTRTMKDGSARTFTITRQFLATEAIRVTFVQAEADAAIAADETSK